MLKDKLISTFTVELEKYLVINEDDENDAGYVYYRESDNSACKRISETFGFDARRVKIIHNEYAYYDDGILTRAHIEVCGIEYSIDINKIDIYKW